MRRRAALALLLLAASCGGPAAGPDGGLSVAAPPQVLRYVRAELPKVEKLPCFSCHDFSKWGEGGRFPHAFRPHRKVGHCHVCHVGVAHHGTRLDLGSCKGCHDEIPEME